MLGNTPEAWLRATNGEGLLREHAAAAKEYLLGLACPSCESVGEMRQLEPRDQYLAECRICETIIHLDESTMKNYAFGLPHWVTIEEIPPSPVIREPA